MKRTLSIVVLLAFGLLLSACGEVRVPSDAQTYQGEICEAVQAELSQAGFTDIEVVTLEDLTSKDSLPDGAVETVSIGGSTEFKAKDKFPADTKIIITCHIVPKLQPPFSSDALQDTPYEMLVQKLREVGFTNVRSEEVYDLDPDLVTVDFENEILFNGSSSFTTEDNIPFDAEVIVRCHHPYEKYTAKILVDCLVNLIFSRYNVVFSLDGVEQATLEHGAEAEYSLYLPEGEHTLTFASEDDSSVNGSVTLDIYSDLEASFSLSCHADSINVKTLYIDRAEELSDDEIKMPAAASEYRYKNYQSTVSALKELGFTNITATPQYDIIVGFLVSDGEVDEVSINGSTEFRRGDVFPKDAEVIVLYHAEDESDAEDESSAADITTEKTLLAYERVLTEYTLYYLIDFENGTVQYFSTNDTSVLTGNVNGDLQSGLNIHFEDGGGFDETLRCKVSNSDDVMILKDANGFEWEFTKTDPAKVKALLTDGASSSSPKPETSSATPAPTEDSRDTLPEYQAKRAFEYYGNALYPYGFDCHWFTELYEHKQDADGSWTFKVGVTVTNQYGASRDAVASAYINNTAQTVENFKVE